MHFSFAYKIAMAIRNCFFVLIQYITEVKSAYFCGRPEGTPATVVIET